MAHTRAAIVSMPRKLTRWPQAADGSRLDRGDASEAEVVQLEQVASALDHILAASLLQEVQDRLLLLATCVQTVMG